MFSKMPFILLLLILIITSLGGFIPLNIKQGLYSISVVIKDIISLLLPFVVFSLLFKAMVNLSDNASKIIGLILGLVYVSSAFGLFFSYLIGKWVYSFNLVMIMPQEAPKLSALFSLNITNPIPNDKAMFAGVILGLLMAKFNHSFAVKISSRLDYVVKNILKLFIYMIPIFVTGFIAKLEADGSITTIIKDYGPIFIVIASALLLYITFLYLLVNNFKINTAIESIKNMLPAAISGFTTMSSAASMPLTILGAEKNSHNKDVAQSVIPSTVNIHLVGDCFATPIFAYAILKSFAIEEPTILNYFIFVFYFILAKFSVAGIPGGGIIVMLPILAKYLNFNIEMTSLITALYILFDSFITCANVMGNGAFAQAVDKITARALFKK
jgi:Na+/H+-dicarboxylate symporter